VNGACLHVVADGDQRGVLAAAVKTAERAMHVDGAHVQELVTWTSPPRSPRRD
jgi:hypothetical protein